MIDYTIKVIEKAVLIGLITPTQNEEKSGEYLDELEFLTLTAGGEAIKRLFKNWIFPIPKPFWEPVN
jgi:GTP-binding protein HflX